MIWLLALATATPGGWETLSNKEGVVVERRPQAAGLYEVRVMVHAPVTPEQFLQTLWKHEEYPQFVPHLKNLHILREEGDHKFIYEQVKLPLVSDRDYTVRVSHRCDAETHLCEVHFETSNADGPPPSKGYVRIQSIRGGWTLEPADGGADVTYDIFSDPGGAVPSWIINAAQKDASREFVLAMVERAKRNAGIRSAPSSPAR